MERKIGEIFEFGGEWYQCVIGSYCHDCAFGNDNCEEREKITLKETPGLCVSEWRSDCKSVIFKKLEKVGEPYEYFVQHKGIVMLQPYKLFTTPIINGVVCNVNYDTNTIDLEIKQNKEDMEEKGQCGDNRFEIIAKAKEALLKETNIARDEQEMAVIDNILFRCWQMGWLDKYDDTKHSNSESIGKNLKPFSLEAAKAGKPVCTRDGRKARIICFDAKGEKPIIALIANGNSEDVNYYYITGKVRFLDKEDENDLMMLPEKKEGWVNIYRSEKGEYWSGQLLFSTKKDAIDAHDHAQYVTTVKVCWEE